MQRGSKEEQAGKETHVWAFHTLNDAQSHAVLPG